MNFRNFLRRTLFLISCFPLSHGVDNSASDAQRGVGLTVPEGDETLIFRPIVKTLEYEPVSITVTPVKQEIRLNWILGDLYEFDQVVLYTENPEDDNVIPVILVDIEDYPEGSYKTNILYSSTILPTNLSEDHSLLVRHHCLNFWVGTRNNGAINYMSCLKIEPSWMSDHRHLLQDLSVLSLLIPGTHDSANFRTCDRKEDAISQDQDIWGQLVHGVRYIQLDMENYPVYVDANGEPENFFRCKCTDQLPIRLLSDLADIRIFLDIFEREVVFLEFPRLPEDLETVGRHKVLIEIIKRFFGDIAYPRPALLQQIPTLKTMWRKNQRVIVFYGNSMQLVKETPILWEPIRHFFGNSATLLSMYHLFFDSIKVGDDSYEDDNLKVITQHLLTPSELIYVTKPWGLRTFVDVKNNYLDESRSLYRNPGILSTDFIRNTNLVSIAIKINVYKGLRQKFKIGKDNENEVDVVRGPLDKIIL